MSPDPGRATLIYVTRQNASMGALARMGAAP